MDTFQLYKQSGDAVNVWVCGKCGTVGWNKDAAERCCVPRTCKTCGKEEEMLQCYECFKAREAKQERQRFEKAEKTAHWDGWVYADGLGNKNGYFESVEDLLSYLEDQPEFSWPEYAWTCQSSTFVSVDADDIYARIEENGYEDFERGSLHGTDELEAALVAFEKANEDHILYEPDYSKVVLIER